MKEIKVSDVMGRLLDCSPNKYTYYMGYETDGVVILNPVYTYDGPLFYGTYAILELDENPCFILRCTNSKPVGSQLNSLPAEKYRGRLGKPYDKTLDILLAEEASKITEAKRKEDEARLKKAEVDRKIGEALREHQDIFFVSPSAPQKVIDEFYILLQSKNLEDYDRLLKEYYTLTTEDYRESSWAKNDAANALNYAWSKDHTRHTGWSIDYALDYHKQEDLEIAKQALKDIVKSGKLVQDIFDLKTPLESHKLAKEALDKIG